MAKPPVTWVLVADAREAQIYVPKRAERRIPLAGDGKRHPVEKRHQWELVPILAKPLAAESAKDYEVGRHQTGQVFESFSTARHMAAPHMDARDEIRRHFAARIADFLAGAKMGEAFDRLVLVASPKMLGEIGAALDENIRRKVTHRVAKELTRYADEALIERLGKYL